MKVSKFDLIFTHLGEKIKASCEKFKVIKYPQYRVVVNPERKKPLVITFYELNDQSNKFFAFEMTSPTQGPLAKAIARALERKSGK